MNTMTTVNAPRSDREDGRLAYSIQETARMLGVCNKSIRRLILRGLIRPSRALRHLLIPKAELDRFLRDTQ
ncbi:MAG: helix-turn-helix domain-containing protein [Verrucomicrobiales bacterium]|nr:helix-turn-helix domain-containing protein [Verrucomicrobiales bacterium]